LARVSIIAQDRASGEMLTRYLSQSGYTCAFAPDDGSLTDWRGGQEPDLVIIESDSYSRVSELSSEIKRDSGLPILGVVRGDLLGRANGQFSTIDDFATKPINIDEVQLRVKRLLHTSHALSEQELVCGDLRIDQARCEVFVGDRPIVLTFKEYELLKFLMINQGRVCTREMLLDKVWGFDYFGGDRTVDVHIRRLRSKIEDPTHSFIETVRNIGYRLRADS
jgi:DNA-binding response OmpR family regulator